MAGNNVTAYGRQQVEWPDLGSDPGVTLHSQIVAAVGYLSNNITGRWSGVQAFSVGQTIQIEHNFGQTLANLKIVFVEGGVTLRQFDAAAALTVTQVDTNTIQIQNISGVSRTFQIYVYPHFSNIRGSDLDADIDISTSGSIAFEETFAGQQGVNAATGVGVTLNSPDKLHIVLNGGGLSSVQGITAPSPAKGVVAIFTNGTGGVVSFSNDAGTAANRLLTGTGADLQLENNASLLVKYDTVSSKWRVIGSTGGGSLAITVDASHTFGVGDAIFYNGTAYEKSIATSAATAEVLGIVSKVIDADTFQYIPSGEITGLSGLTPGSTYFLGVGLPGVITAIEPTTIGHVSVPVGTALSASKLLVSIKRGYVVGGANARTQIALANNLTTTFQDVSSYDAGEVAGFVTINATTPLKFYLQAQFSKNGAANDYYVTSQTAGDTPPVGFAVTVSSGGLLRITLPNITGFTSASVNFALNAPAVGTNYPISVNQSQVIPNYRSVTSAATISTSDYYVSATGSTDYSVTLPLASTSASKIFIIKSRLDATKILTIAASGSDTIDGSSSVSLFRFESLQLLSNGTTWEIF